MIELGMVFGLGVLAAGLLALACLPAVWSRAMRLTTRRLAQLVPLSMDEIVAERDGLRAGFAVEQRRLEQRLEEVEARRSGLMARLGRGDARIAALEDAAAADAARIADLIGDLEETTRELREVRGETGTAAVALHDLTGLADRQRWEVLAAEEQVRAGQSTIDAHRTTIAALETRIVGLDGRVADLDRALGHVRAELARTLQAVVQACTERDAALASVEALRQERDALRGEVGELKASAEDMRHRAAVETQAASAHRVTLAELRVRLAAQEAQFAMQTEAARGAAERLAALDAANASMTRRLAEPQSAPAEARAPVGEDAELAVLRETLTRVADAVLRLSESGKDVLDAPPSNTSDATRVAEPSLSK